VATLVANKFDGELIYKSDLLPKEMSDWLNSAEEEYHNHIRNFQLHNALGVIWEIIKKANVLVDARKPWVLVKENPKEFEETMVVLVAMIHHITWLLQPFLPETAEKVFKTFGDHNPKNIEDGYKFLINKGEPLFPRLP
jgi:methionyl-tRNA synthetase